MCKAWKIECTCNTDTFHSDCFLVSVHPMVYNLGAEAVCCHRLSIKCTMLRQKKGYSQSSHHFSYV
jgi:hypothetical protein